MTGNALAGRLGRNLLLVGAVVFFGAPLLWLFLAPTRTGEELYTGAPYSFGDLGNVADAWQNIADFRDGAIGRWTVNSITYSLVTVVLVLVTVVPAGFALAKYRFPGRQTALFLTLITMIVPQAALILPLYLELSVLGLTNTAWSVILPLSFYPFGVYLVYIFATTTIPDSLLEAARLDGASELSIFTRIFVPLAVPSIVMVTFFAFVNAWNSFYLPYIMLSSPDDATLQTGLALMVSTTNALGGANFVGLPINEPEVALAAIVTVAPILLVFVFAQRYLVAGQTAAAEKG